MLGSSFARPCSNLGLAIPAHANADMPIAETMGAMAPNLIRLAAGQENSMPPLMSTFAPVMKAAPSEAR